MLLLLLLLLCLLLPLLVTLWLVYRPPSKLIQYFQHRWPDVLWHVPTSDKVIALTIDDGPSIHTREILGILKEHNVTATFFVIGSNAIGNHKDILQDLIRNGNELANHAMSDEPSYKLDNAELASQIRAVEQIIDNTYQLAPSSARSAPRYFRPGSGFFTTRMRKLLQELGYTLVLGGIYPHDPQISFSTVNAAHVLSMARPGGIVICHDGRRWTPPMLKIVLPELKRRGYRIVTVTELLGSRIS
ncbi:uncharacterized protein TRUGW13939_11898 [Talaromyces rugulosus]|uniref:chitin deacetylase n=1 Tax=Talaromyces rugulosus TaxID=121627 RepID=A0A7H8RE08_TALRU|nr:uncharacterized protein TRUGW13939_11898 [Talaromyces rugulosus]QKX64722.1 hypothetical protein TRUGW13939_11898 [Talaromyces rugulosus]